MISIIGGGPIGSYTAFLLAEAGKSVHVFEQKGKIGEPMQCTGIVTKELLKIIDIPDELILNKVKMKRVFAPDGTSIDIPNEDLVIDRVSFDKWLAKKAQDAGVKYHMHCRFMGFKHGKMVIQEDKNDGFCVIREYNTNLLIGADGPLSEVAKTSGLYGKREFYAGAQAIVKGNFDLSVNDIYLDVPHFFGWCLPECKGRARIGVAARHNTREHFDRLLAQYNCEIVDMQGGLIPIYSGDKSSGMYDDIPVYLVGDAASHVKATTGGGIVQGMIAAQCLKDAIVQEKTANIGKRYEQLLKKRLRKQLWIHLLIRKTLNKFSDADYNELVKMLNDEKVKKVFAEFSRDNPIRLAFKLFLAKPSLLKFYRRLF